MHKTGNNYQANQAGFSALLASLILAVVGVIIVGSQWSRVQQIAAHISHQQAADTLVKYSTNNLSMLSQLISRNNLGIKCGKKFKTTGFSKKCKFVYPTTSTGTDPTPPEVTSIVYAAVKGGKSFTLRHCAPKEIDIANFATTYQDLFTKGISGCTKKLIDTLSVVSVKRVTVDGQDKREITLKSSVVLHTKGVVDQPAYEMLGRLYAELDPCDGEDGCAPANSIGVNFEDLPPANADKDFNDVSFCLRPKEGDSSNYFKVISNSSSRSIVAIKHTEFVPFIGHVSACGHTVNVYRIPANGTPSDKVKLASFYTRNKDINKPISGTLPMVFEAGEQLYIDAESSSPCVPAWDMFDKDHSKVFPNPQPNTPEEERLDACGHCQDEGEYCQGAFD